MSRVSLFDRAGKFVAYVEVQGTPHVVVYKGTYYVSYDQFGTTRSFRECTGEIVD